MDNQIVTTFRLFCIKNAMLMANLIATTIGAGLLFVIYEFVLRGHQTDRYVEFHIRTSNYFGLIFLLFFTLIIVYEWPVRKYLNKIYSNSPVSSKLESRAKRRLLNEPFFIIGIDTAAWIIAGVAFAFFERSYGLSWHEISLNRIDALLTGLVSITIAFFLLERILQTYMIPYFFPTGKLYNVQGTKRINLSVRLGAVFVAINLIPSLVILISLYRVAISDRSATESLNMLTSGLWILIPVAVILGGALILILSLSLKRSLDAMVVVLKRVSIGQFDSRVKVTSNDEIGYVGDVINEMTTGLIDRDNMRQSLDLAKEVQQNLLPKCNPKIQGFDIAGTSVFCDQTGGDYYDFFTFNHAGKEDFGVAIGDVSGHGISSALLMASVRSSLRQRLSQPGSISQIISDVNLQLVKDVEDSGDFMTLLYLSVDPSNHLLQWVRAGHDPGIIYDPVADKFESLKGKGIALGVDKDWQYETNKRAGIIKGQIIVLSTDGIWEAHDRAGDMFGKDRFYNIIRQNSAKSADEILQTLMEALNQFQKNSAREDDMTLVILKNKGNTA